VWGWEERGREGRGWEGRGREGSVVESKKILKIDPGRMQVVYAKIAILDKNGYRIDDC